MIWIFVILASAVLAVLLLTALRRYEQESASAARREVQALRAEVEHLVERVETLEALAAGDDVGLGRDPTDVSAADRSAEPGESVSSPRARRTR